MNLEPVIQSEVSQKEKNKYCILMCVCVCVCVYIYICIYIYIYIYMQSKKMVQMNLFAGPELRGSHRDWTCGHSGGRRGWDELTE